MKVLWLCNMAPSAVRKAMGGTARGGLWMDHVLTDLAKVPRMELHIILPGEGESQGQAFPGCTYGTFCRRKPQEIPSMDFFVSALQQYKPDVIHIWGTEFGHTLSMLRACETLGLLEKTVVSIQGLCSVIARHYAEGIPVKDQRHYTFRDMVRRDNILGQQRTFSLRGENEIRALQLARHVIGRTPWDRTCVRLINPEIMYHFCNETLREEFYTGSWSYESCEKHRIFASSHLYALKGFHYLLEALAMLRKNWPDAVVAVPGRDPVARTLKQKLHQDGYARYLEKLIRENHLEGSIQYLGTLSAEEMKQQYLLANAFVMPSTVENSPNSLGEAMLLGTPCVASHVGGVTTMLEPGEEGLVYPSTAPYMLENALEEIFHQGKQAEAMGQRAAAHARRTHDPETNFRALLQIYEQLSGKELT